MTIVVIPYQACLRATIREETQSSQNSQADDPTWPNVRYTQDGIDAQSCERYRLHLDSPTFFQKFMRVINAAGDDRFAPPCLPIQIPWYSWLRSTAYRKRWLGLDNKHTSMILPQQFPLLIERSLQQRPEPIPVPTTWPSEWNVQWIESSSIAGRPGTPGGHPIVGICASFYPSLWSDEASKTIPALIPCEGNHRSGPKHQACLKSHGIAKYSLYLHGANLKTEAQKSRGVCRYVNSEGVVVFV